MLGDRQGPWPQALAAEGTVAFNFDEKAQCQGLDRTRPSLPLKPGRAGTMTHDQIKSTTNH